MAVLPDLRLLLCFAPALVLPRPREHGPGQAGLTGIPKGPALAPRLGQGLGEERVILPEPERRLELQAERSGE
ncbi:hypothetical protein FJY69_05170 [candidate division WOR-3 bacterium]|nr:hypothetical protein [candidate division WOR-3 bacterium]